MDLKECLQQAINAHASDVFIIAGLPVSLRKNNVICQFSDEKLLPADTENILSDIYRYAGDRFMKRETTIFPLPLRGCPVSVSARTSSVVLCPRLSG